jgi:hypothetical protein
METALPLAGLAGLMFVVWKFIDFLRYFANFSSQKSAVVTQALSWLGGIAGVFLFAETQWGAIDIQNIGTVSAMNTASKILLGLAVASAASTGVDLFQSIDGTNSNAKPPLLDAPPQP